MASLQTPGYLRPPLSSMKKSILHFIQGLVSYNVYRSISLILSPCCSPSIVSATFNCIGSHTNMASYTITISSPIAISDGNYELIISGIVIDSQPYNGELTLTGTFSGTSQVAGNNNVQLYFFQPANESIAVIIPSNKLKFEIPDCS